MYRQRSRLDAALRKIRSNLELLVVHGELTTTQAEAALGRLIPADNLADAVGTAAIVLENVPEDLELKRGLYRDLGALCPPTTILASNTSSFRITDLGAAAGRPGEVCGIHWVGPPYIVPVVEVIIGEQTSPETIERARAFARRVGKVPVVARDVPGFIMVRLIYALLNEAIALVEQGVGSAQDVDNAYRLGPGILAALLGPLRQNDLAVNMQTVANVLAYLYRETKDTKFKPPPTLDRHIAEGRLGLGSGKGWYDYEGLDPEAVRRWRDEKALAYLRLLRHEQLLVENPLR
jgi:3-hydroxybutyryl-CoA dehydrogenase